MATATQAQPQKEPAQKPLIEQAIDATYREAMTRPEVIQMRMENEIMISECRARPRDFEAIKAELLENLQAFPALAQEAIYVKPVGKGDDGQMKYAEGLSIRAAEVLAEAYGYNRVRADVTPIDDDKVKIDATFSDFQKSRIWQDGGILSKWYKSSGGGMKKVPDDRFYSVVVKAESSRRVREVILRSINSGLKAWFEAECRKLNDKSLTPDEIKSIIGHFRDKGVSLEQLSAFIGREPDMGWTSNDKQMLLGIWNAIKTGETTVQEAFPPIEEPAKKPTGPVTGAALTKNGKGKAAAKNQDAEDPPGQSEMFPDAKPEANAYSGAGT